MKWTEFFFFVVCVCVCVCVCWWLGWSEVQGYRSRNSEKYPWWVHLSQKIFRIFNIFIGRLMLKLKLQYFGHLMWRTDLLRKMLMLGKTEGRGRGNKEWDDWMASPSQWAGVCASSGRWWRIGKPGVLSSTRLNNWTTTNNFQLIHRTLFSLGERHAVNLLEQQWVLEAAITYN